MINDKFKLPDELLQVEQKYTAYLKSDFEYPAYSKSFYTAIDIWENSKEGYIQEELAKRWLVHFEHWMNKGGLNELIVKEIDRFIAYVAKNNLTSSLFDDKDDVSILAIVCLSRVNLRQGGIVHPKELNVEQLLSQWSQRELPEGTTRSTEKAVDFLYGPACWSLYRDDVAGDYAMPDYIWKEKVPVVIGNSKDLTVAPTTLPDLGN